MIDFVKEGASHDAFGLDFYGGAVFEEGADFGVFRTGNETVIIRDGETAFVIFFDAARGREDFGVN